MITVFPVPTGITTFVNGGTCFIVYPNPVTAGDDLNIFRENVTTGNAEVAITDVTGWQL